MSEDSARRREELVRKYKDPSAAGSAYEYRSRNAGHNFDDQSGKKISFLRIRIVVSIVLFIGFYLFQRFGGDFIGNKAETVIKEVSTNFDINEAIEQVFGRSDTENESQQDESETEKE